MTWFRYYYELSILFPNKYNSMKQNGCFHVYGLLRANEHSSEYKIEFCLKRNRIIILLHGLNVPEQDLNRIPHIFVSQSDANSGTVSLCLFRNKKEKREFKFGDNLRETIIPWIQEWLYFYELYLITGKWYGNGEHPEKS